MILSIGSEVLITSALAVRTSVNADLRRHARLRYYRLSQPDLYLSAAVCGGSLSNQHGLRQEETSDGPQQALGRHLDHFTGAE